MRYRIHFTLPDGSDDSVVISGDTFEECKEQAHKEVAKRNATDPWTEPLNEEVTPAKETT